MTKPREQLTVWGNPANQRDVPLQGPQTSREALRESAARIPQEVVAGVERRAAQQFDQDALATVLD